MRFIPFVIFVLLTNAITVFGKDFNCSGIPQEFVVTASSGVLLRSKPSLQGNIMAKIPAGYTIQVCTPQWGTQDTIAGKGGKWLNAFYDGIEGYVFNTNIQYSKQNIQLFIPDEYDWVEDDANFYGLYDTTSQFDSEYFVLEQTQITQDGFLEDIDGYPVDLYQTASVFGGKKPKFLIAGINPGKQDIIKGIEGNDEMLLPGQGIQLTLGENQFLLYAEGDLVAADNTTTFKAFQNINNYQVKIKSLVDGKISTQVIFQKDIIYYNMGYAETAINLVWAGDLDGDDQIDALLKTTGSHSWSYHLFLSSKADKGQAVKEVARKDFDCGC